MVAMSRLLLLSSALALAASARLAVSPKAAPGRCEEDRSGLPSWLFQGRRTLTQPPVRRLRGGAVEPSPSVASFKSWLAKKSEGLKEAAAAPKKNPDREKAVLLMKQRGLDKCEKAVGLLRSALKKSQGTSRLRWSSPTP